MSFSRYDSPAAPCPKCGSPFLSQMVREAGYYIKCDACGRRGPITASGRPLEEWNNWIDRGAHPDDLRDSDHVPEGVVPRGPDKAPDFFPDDLSGGDIGFELLMKRLWKTIYEVAKEVTTIKNIQVVAALEAIKFQIHRAAETPPGPNELGENDL